MSELPCDAGMGVDDVKCYDCEYLEKTTCHHPANPRPVGVDPFAPNPCRKDMETWLPATNKSVYCDEDNRRKPWTPDEDQYIIEHATEPAQDIAASLGRSKAQVCYRRKILADSIDTHLGPYKPYTESEKQWVIEHMNNTPPKQIAATLGRSVGSISSFIYKTRRKQRQTP